jgi:inosine-uridine nucleoside N-ribohydrolase
MIIETDLGRDCDDLLAILWLIEHGYNIKAITITPGDPDQVSVARAINKLYGLNIPIGVSKLNRDRSSSNPFHKTFVDKAKIPFSAKPDGEGKDIIKGVYENYDNVLILGPCTNIGKFMAENPDTVFGMCTMQGGFLPCDDFPKFAGMKSVSTFNLNGDRKHADVFLNHNMEMRQMCGKNVCHRHEYFHDKISKYPKKKDSHLHSIELYEHKCVHDVIATICHVDISVGEWVLGKTVRMDGGWTTDLNGEDFILKAIDEDRFWELYAT